MPDVDPHDQPDVPVRRPADLLDHDDRPVGHGQAGVRSQVGQRDAVQSAPFSSSTHADVRNRAMAPRPPLTGLE